MNNNDSTGTWVLCGIGLVLICGATLFTRFMTGMFQDMTRLFNSVGKAMHSFIGMVWWLALAITLVVAVYCVCSGALYFLKKFLAIVKEGTELREAFLLKTTELENLYTAEKKSLVTRVERRLNKMEKTIEEVMREPSVEPETAEESDSKTSSEAPQDPALNEQGSPSGGADDTSLADDNPPPQSAF